MGRNWLMDNWMYGAVAGMIIVSAVFVSNFICNDSQDRASIVRFSGAVSIERAGGRITPVKGMILNANDRIVTAKGSSIEVTYDQGLKDIVKIGSDSRVVLESGLIEKQTNIFLDQGDVVLKLERLEKGSTFKVRTPVGVAGVRGTSFGVQVRGKEAVIFDFESRIFVKGINTNFVENKDELLLNEGWKVELRQFEQPSRVAVITAEERAAWLEWIKDITLLSSRASMEARPESFYEGLFSGVGAVVHDLLLLKPAGLLGAMVNKMFSSVPVLAFLLYFVMIINVRKVFAYEPEKYIR